MQKDLTKGNVFCILVGFALPYLASCFMQTLYGMVDLAVVGLFCSPVSTSAVATGSQVMHAVTVMVAGLLMGVAVLEGNAVGAKDQRQKKQVIATSVIFFLCFSLLLSCVLISLKNQIVLFMKTPQESIEEAVQYLFVCFLGVPFIFCFNTISALLRGQGNSRLPMIFVFFCCILNVILDFVLVGHFGMGTFGAALATVAGQAASSIMGIVALLKKQRGFFLSKKDFCIAPLVLMNILKVGIPISLQDGFIQLSFVIITMVANSRGLVVSCAVGITEKLICFMFLVPSAFLSAISGVTAQNIGAKKENRAVKSLELGLAISIVWGALCVLFSNIFAKSMIALFSKDENIIQKGSEYLSSYSFDVLFAAVHFCFSGFFCGISKPFVSFLHNIISIVTIRVPGVYLATRLFPQSLFPMGLAAPLGSLVSSIICVFYFCYMKVGSKTKQKVKSTLYMTVHHDSLS